MKHIYVLLMLLISTISFSQFVHMKPGEEAQELVELIMNDGVVRIGNVKNNRPDKIVLRILSQDAYAFRHAPVEVDYIQFKEKESDVYEKISADKIKKIVFQGEEIWTFDRINVYKFKKKTLKVNRENVAYMFQMAKVDDVFKVYSNLYFDQRGGSAPVLNYFVKHRDSEDTFYFNMSGQYLPRQLPLLKILAPQNEKYVAYIDKLRDKKSEEYKEYKLLDEERDQEVKRYFEEQGKKISRVEKASISINSRYNFLFYFIGKKLEQFSS